MFQRALLAFGAGLALLSACGPAALGGLAHDSSTLSAGAALGASGQAAAQQAAPAPQASPTIQWQFPPPAPNMAPGPNVVAPSPTDDRAAGAPPVPMQAAPSPAPPA